MSPDEPTPSSPDAVSPDDDVSTETDGFQQFDLAEPLIRAVTALGFESPTPIQCDAIPALLSGSDVVGGARTGSGKTAAFGLPLLQGITEMRAGVRALVLTPTRELAVQVTDALRDYAAQTKIRVSTIYGGVPYRSQLRDLRNGTPVVVGTPGRLLDHLDRGSLDLTGVELVVIDEADEMLRMGFIEDVTRLIEATPEGRQVALFSATMPAPIRRIASRYLNKPISIQVESKGLTVDHIEQRGMVVPERAKLEALVRVLLSETYEAVLVFARTRSSCNELAEALVSRGLQAGALHGDMNQAARERVLNAMRENRLDIVVATDVAARGIDVAHITHVINLDLPNDTETYVHRIGRTGRAGRIGKAISFVTPVESRRLGSMERRLKVEITPMPVPTDADIVHRRQAAFQADVLRAFSEDGVTADEAAGDAAKGNDTSGDQATIERFFDALVESTGLSERELALRAFTLLAKDRRVPLDDDADDRPPHWARRRDSGTGPRATRRVVQKPARRGAKDRQAFDAKDKQAFDANAVALFLPIGRNEGVRPSDIVWGLTDATGLPGGMIGRITIHGRNSFVGLAPEVAKRVLASTNTISVRGNDVPVSLATLQNKAG